MEPTRFLVEDTETTGMKAGEDRVVEYAAVELIWEEGEARYGVDADSLVDPGIPIPPAASAVHHLTDEDVAGAPALETLLAEFSKTLDPGTSMPTAHNAAFDAAFLPDPWKPRLCTWRLALHLWPDLESHKNQFLRYFFKLQVPHVEGLQAHRAKADAFVTAAILKHALETLAATQPELLASWRTAEDLAAWAEQPVLLKTCYFGNKWRGSLWKDVEPSYLRWMLQNVTDMDADTRFTVESYLRK